MNEDYIKELYVGKNYNYYKKGWNLENTKKFIPSRFNWAACFFALPWLAYRKMYFWAVLYICITTFIDLMDHFVPTPFNVSIWKYFATPIGLIIGCRANYWYKKHVEKQLKTISEKNHNINNIEDIIRIKGGTSVWGAIILTIIGLTLSIVIGSDRTIWGDSFK